MEVSAPEVDAAGVGDARAEQVEVFKVGEGRDGAEARVREAAAVQVQLRKRRELRHRRQSRVSHSRCAPDSDFSLHVVMYFLSYVFLFLLARDAPLQLCQLPVENI